MGSRALVGSVLLSVAMGTVGHGQSAPPPVPPDPAGGSAAAAALHAARQATDELSATLVGRLEAEIKERGPLAALDVCAEVAQSLTAAKDESGLTIRRVSLQARNPVDRPSDAERAVLDQLAAAHAQGEMPTETWAVVDGELRYYRPIIVREVCLRCHGATAQLQPELQQRLGELYPEDQAVGYAVGDLRGAVAVRVALPVPAPQ